MKHRTALTMKSIARVLTLAAFHWCSFSAFAQHGPMVAVCETGGEAPEAMDLHAGPPASWTIVEPEVVDHAFAMAAAMFNDRLYVLAAPDWPGIYVYSRGQESTQLRAVLAPAGDADAISGVTLEQNGTTSATLNVAFDATSGLRVSLDIGAVYVKVTGYGSAEAMAVRVPSPYIVMPDFFADDIVIAADEIPVPRTELPSENFLLHMAGANDAIVMSVWENREQDVRINLADHEQGRVIASSEVTFGENGAIWVAVLDRPDIWRTRTVSEEDRDKIIPLGWTRPFDAVWRVDWRRKDGLTDSWEMALENADGSYSKSDLFEVSRDDWTDSDWWADDKPRLRWNTGMGSYMYPCWIDKNGNGYLQPLKKRVRFEGPVVLYPINRRADTPLDVFTVTDVVRSTLGVGPCQYILDVEGQDLDFQGRPTCDTRDLLDPIYEDGEQVKRHDDVVQALDDVQAFMQLIRNRIEAYRGFAMEMEQYLTAQKAANPNLAAFVDAMLVLNAEIPSAIEERAEGIKTPQYAVDLVDKFRTEVLDYTGPDAEDRCKELTRGFVRIGDNQDELVAECRLAVKQLRQRSALAMATDPQLADIVSEIRNRTQAILRDPVNYEAARH